MGKDSAGEMFLDGDVFGSFIDIYAHLLSGLLCLTILWKIKDFVTRWRKTKGNALLYSAFQLFGCALSFYYEIHYVKVYYEGTFSCDW